MREPRRISMQNTSLTSEQIRDEPNMSAHGKKHELELSQIIYPMKKFHKVFIVAKQNKAANKGIF